VYYMVLSTPLIIAGYYFGGVLGGVAGAVVVPVGALAYTKYKEYKSRQVWAAQDAERKARELKISTKKAEENAKIEAVDKKEETKK